jgi:hypothetical protein
MERESVEANWQGSALKRGRKTFDIFCGSKGVCKAECKGRMEGVSACFVLCSLICTMCFVWARL